MDSEVRSVGVHAYRAAANLTRQPALFPVVRSARSTTTMARTASSSARITAATTRATSSHASSEAEVCRRPFLARVLD